MNEVKNPYTNDLAKDGGDLRAGSKVSRFRENIRLRIEAVFRVSEAQLPVT